nr:MAG TPA: hypothetical protein [Caudoviricetes sp.]DAX48302.1 MAG TPA: hypothetical protein [Caudoviricetes sp.]
MCLNRLRLDDFILTHRSTHVKRKTRCIRL